MKKIMVAGSLVLDILPVFDNSVTANALVEEGKVVECGDVRMYLGGEVGNTGLAMTRLGTDAVLVSKVGDDDAGSVVQALLKKAGANARITAVSGMPSTVSIAIALSERDKSTIHRRGASQTFVASDIEDPLFAQADWFHFGYPTTMSTLFNNQGQELIKLVKKAKAHGVGVSLDTSLPDLRTEAGRVDWSSILPEVLPYVDLFLPSAEESMFLVDREGYRQRSFRLGGADFTDFLEDSQVRDMAEAFIRWGSKAVLIKCGKRGLYFRSSRGLAGEKREDISLWENRELWRAPSRPERILSTTGAGDTAIAGFLCGYLNRISPERSLDLASLCARSCLESYDTVGRLTDFRDMLAEEDEEQLKVSLDTGYWRWNDRTRCYQGRKDLCGQKLM